MPNTIRVAASASLAALSALFALPLYIIAVGWLVMSLPQSNAKPTLAPVPQDYTVQVPETGAAFVNPQARDEKKFEQFGTCTDASCGQTQLVGWRLFRRSQPQNNCWQPVQQPTAQHSDTGSSCPDGTCPQVQKTPAQKPTANDPEKNFKEKKTGAVRCECCKKVMVGAGQKTYWTPDNQPLTYLCTECAGTLPTQEQKRVMESWLARVAPTLPPSVKASYLASIP